MWDAERSWMDLMGQILGATAIVVGSIALLAIGQCPYD